MYCDYFKRFVKETEKSCFETMARDKGENYIMFASRLCCQFKQEYPSDDFQSDKRVLAKLKYYIYQSCLEEVKKLYASAGTKDSDTLIRIVVATEQSAGLAGKVNVSQPLVSELGRLNDQKDEHSYALALSSPPAFGRARSYSEGNMNRYRDRSFNRNDRYGNNDRNNDRNMDFRNLI